MLKSTKIVIRQNDVFENHSLKYFYVSKLALKFQVGNL